jgi:hypothetical protein
MSTIAFINIGSGVGFINGLLKCCAITRLDQDHLNKDVKMRKMNPAKSKFYAQKDREILESSKLWVIFYYDIAGRRGTLEALLRLLWRSYSVDSPSTEQKFLKIGKDLALTNGSFSPDRFVREEERMTAQSLYYAPYLDPFILKKLKFTPLVDYSGTD